VAKPLEQQSLKWPFVILSGLLAVSAAWAVWDEVVSRRPWKEHQREFFALAERHLRADLARAEKRLEAPEARTRLEAARAELAAAEQAISGSPEQRRAHDAAATAEERARRTEADAKLRLGFEKSERDALYYELREARHEGGRGEAALRARLDAKEAEIARGTKLLAAARAERERAT
jgi:hypothetical protein